MDSINKQIKIKSNKKKFIFEDVFFKIFPEI